MAKSGITKRRQLAVQPPCGKVSRALFRKPSATSSKWLEAELKKLFKDESARCMLKWNFNAESGLPLNGNWQWEAPAATRGVEETHADSDAELVNSSSEETDVLAHSGDEKSSVSSSVTDILSSAARQSKVVQTLKQTNLKGKLRLLWLKPFSFVTSHH